MLSRILNKPPTLTQPLQSSPKQNTRKKYISNLRLYNMNMNANSNNQTVKTAATANQSSRSFVNNRTPNSWTFAMISNNLNNVNSINSINSSTMRRHLQPNAFSRGLPLNSNRNVLKQKNATSTNLIVSNGNQSNNNTLVNLSSLQASFLTKLTKPIRSPANNSNKQLSSTRRPFLSRSINYKPLTGGNSTTNLAKNNQTTADASTDGLVSNELVSNKPIVVEPKTRQKRKQFNLKSNSNSIKRPKPTFVAISSSTGQQQPFNFNPIQFMQNISTFFDQIFSPKSNRNNFFSWIN